MNRAQVCCFTGHRPETLAAAGLREGPLAEQIAQAVEQAVHSGYVSFLCGASRGADFLFGEAVVRLRERYPHIKLVCVLPCRNQPDRWESADRARYRRLLDAADEVVCLRESYEPGCMQARNRYMVDRATRLIAVYTGAPGGTAYTVRYAQRQMLSVVNLSGQAPQQVSFEEAMQEV